jgi:hypothetical protein
MKLSEFKPSELVVKHVQQVIDTSGWELPKFYGLREELLAYAAQLKLERDALARQLESWQRNDGPRGGGL